MKRSIIALIVLSLSGCAIDQPTPNDVYTSAKAEEQMNSFIKAHAALSNTTPGQLETHCELMEKLDEDETNEYACVSLVKDQNLVLQADCSIDLGCEATGYLVWDDKQQKFVEPNPKMAEVAQ